MNAEIVILYFKPFDPSFGTKKPVHELWKPAPCPSSQGFENFGIDASIMTLPDSIMTDERKLLRKCAVSWRYGELEIWTKLDFERVSLMISGLKLRFLKLPRPVTIITNQIYKSNIMNYKDP